MSGTHARSLSQRDILGEHGDELVTALAKQLSGRIGRAKSEQQPMGDSAAFAESAVRQDISTFETMIDATEAER